ncbi:peptidylprolyl isomerase [Microbacterium sp. USHLN186]|uniref:peptidylprolyl isomerase n=1 Tax=Microbacterium sp. USHLN186 TaxID=3081286 RepID=UPI0030166304
MLTPRLRRSLLALTAAAALVLTGCASTPDADPSGSAGAAPQSTASADAGTCSYPTDDREPAKTADPPAAEPTAAGQVPVTVATSVGDLAVTLDADKTPCTVNSFLSLAEQGYFDGTACHRLTTQGIFVLQCGDPTGTGTGGPGYSFGDELDGSETYPAGTLAMANAGPDTNGSQFFIVYADSQLPPSYTVFGHLDEASTKTVAAVAEKGTEDGGPDGAPKTPVQIESVTAG